MAVGQPRKTYKEKGPFGRTKSQLAQRDERLIKALTKRLDKAKGNYNKWKQMSPSKRAITYGGSEKSWNRRIDSLQASINEARGVKKQDFTKRPLKVSDKGLKPARTLAKGESKIGRGTIIGGKGPGDAGNLIKRKKKEEYDPRKANRAGQRMGQRKAGGMIKKYSHGGKVTRGDGIAKRGHTKGRVV